MVEVPDASARLLSERVQGAAGTTVLAALEGSRTILAEVQALVGQPTPATPGRTVLGMDRGRLQMLLAVLAKWAFNSMTEMYFCLRQRFACNGTGSRLGNPNDLQRLLLRHEMKPLITEHFSLEKLVWSEKNHRSIVSHPAQRLAEAKLTVVLPSVIAPKSAQQHMHQKVWRLCLFEHRVNLGHLFMG